ncbi:MAG: hypothetical protein J6P20_05415, partial [Oscillospiraceae bacterium]|nr:hypothetical protein [Oscillospiraceae bacterium]
MAFINIVCPNCGGKAQIESGRSAMCPYCACELNAQQEDQGFAFAKERTAAAPLAEYPGEVGEKTGWKCVGSEEGKVVYIPFEGYYESKGGRIESPRF